MSDFFSIYNSIGRRGGYLTEAALSVDSNRDVTSRGNSHNDKTLTDPNTRDKILHARIQEIEAFAKDRGIEPLIAIGASEAALRTGRIPNLTMYGLHGDNMVALKHFIAGEILNLAGMEAINWDGTPIEEADEPASRSHANLSKNLLTIITKHKFNNRDDIREMPEAEQERFRRFQNDARRHVKTLLKGGKFDTSEPHWHQIHDALTNNQNAVDTVFKNNMKEYEPVMDFVTTMAEKKKNENKPQEKWGVAKPEADPNEMKRKGGNIGGPQVDDIEINGQLQQEYGSPSDRNASPTSNITGAPSAAANHPTEPGKKQPHGTLSRKTIESVKRAQNKVKTNEKGDKGTVSKLDGLTAKQVTKLGRELGVLNTGETESVEIKNKDLLNIEPGDFRNETWPKMSDDLRRLLDLDKQPQTHGIRETEAPKKAVIKDVKVHHWNPPMSAGDPCPKCKTEGKVGGKMCLTCGGKGYGSAGWEHDPKLPVGWQRPKTDQEDYPGDPQNESWPKMGPELRRLLNVESRGLYFNEQGRHGGTALPGNVAPIAPAIAPAAPKSTGGRKVSAGPRPVGDSMAETTTAGSVGSFMRLGNQIVSRPNTIATWDASVDLNGFQPARLGMVTPDPVFPVAEARRYRDADAAADFIASKKLVDKYGASNIALHKGDDDSIHVQIRGAKGKDGTHPSEDAGNERTKFKELTRSERGKFVGQPAEVQARTKEAMTGVPGVRGTVAPDTKRYSAMQTLRSALAKIMGRTS